MFCINQHCNWGIMKQVRKHTSYKMEDKRIEICYAADIVLLAENENDIQRLLYLVYTTAKQLKISTTITK